jgi:hypothetical protein
LVFSEGSYRQEEHGDQSTEKIEGDQQLSIMKRASAASEHHLSMVFNAADHSRRRRAFSISRQLIFRKAR